MTEPLPQADAQPQNASLWDKAPAWRTLTVTASLLTLAAVATPLLLPGPADRPVKPALAADAGKLLLPKPVPTPTPRNDVALATPAPVRHAAAPAQQASCALKQSATAPRLLGFGTVVGFEDRALAMARIRFTEQQSGGRIDPAFIDNPRVVVKSPAGQLRTFILPNTMRVQIGDRVMVQNGYRNAALPCNYVPNEIASDIGPAPAQTNPVQAAEGQSDPAQMAADPGAATPFP